LQLSNNTPTNEQHYFIIALSKRPTKLGIESKSMELQKGLISPFHADALSCPLWLQLAYFCNTLYSQHPLKTHLIAFHLFTCISKYV
jgi:hypothetical protein